MPKLTLRDLFAIVTIVALALGWWVDHVRQDSLRRENQSLRYQVQILTGTLKDYGVTVNITENNVTVTRGRAPTDPAPQ